MTNRRSRRQTRQRRNDGWPPEWHNEAVRVRKANIRHAKRFLAARRERARATALALPPLSAAAHRAADGIRAVSVALIGFGQAATALAEAEERRRQIAHADRMAAAGFDMREEHEALERGELVD